MKKSAIEVAIRWNGSLISVEHFYGKNGIVIGSRSGVHIPVFDSSIPKEGHRIVEWDSEKVWVRNAPWMKVWVNGVPSKDERLSLGERDEIEVTIGAVTLHIVRASADLLPMAGIFANVDKR